MTTPGPVVPVHVRRLTLRARDLSPELCAFVAEEAANFAIHPQRCIDRGSGTLFG